MTLFPVWADTSLRTTAVLLTFTSGNHLAVILLYLIIFGSLCIFNAIKNVFLEEVAFLSSSLKPSVTPHTHRSVDRRRLLWLQLKNKFNQTFFFLNSALKSLKKYFIDIYFFKVALIFLHIH